MADEGMVALRDALGKILASEHADVLREGSGSPTTTSQRYMRARWPSSESPPRKGT